MREFAHNLKLDHFRFDHAILKRPMRAARTPWHQDAPYAGSKFKNLPELHFWIPFDDVFEKDGCMEYLPGSHLSGLVSHQAFDRTAARPGWSAEVADTQHAVSCPVRAGGMLIHTPLTLHAAGANRSCRPRLAWILHFDRVGQLRAAKRRLLTTWPKRPAAR